jgi:hypothetical protein
MELGTTSLPAPVLEIRIFPSRETPSVDGPGSRGLGSPPQAVVACRGGPVFVLGWSERRHLKETGKETVSLKTLVARHECEKK